MGRIILGVAPFPFKIDFLPAEELILVFLPPRRPENDISAPFCCRSSSAHVSGRLQGPFWDQFSPQKCSFVDLLSGPVGHICWGDFSLNVGYFCPLKFDCFGRCEKKAHMACDPQKPMDFQDFCMCAAPPATQQGRQQRTINSPNKHKNIKNSIFIFSAWAPENTLPNMTPKYLQK